eukprot:10862499-Alexandrium_andersonii.AAC.1
MGFGGGATSSSPAAKSHSSPAASGAGSGELWELPSSRLWTGAFPWSRGRSAARRPTSRQFQH